MNNNLTPKILCLLLLVLITAPASLVAQDFLIEEYDPRRKLEPRNIHYVIQTDDKIIWVATDLGIYNYDGVDWNKQEDSNHIDGSEYLQMAFCNDRYLWALPNRTIYRFPYYDGNKWNSIDPLSFDKSTRTFSVRVIDGNINILLVTSEDDLFLYENESWRKIYKPRKNSKVFSNITTIENKFVLALEDGLYRVENDSLVALNNFNRLLPSFDIQHVKRVYTDPSSENREMILWLLSSTWIGHIIDNQLIIVSDDINLPFTHMTKNRSFLQSDKEGRMFWGNNDAIYFANKTTGSVRRISFEHDRISSGANEIEIDHENNIWLATKRGLKKIRLTPFTNLNQAKGLPFNEVAAAAKTKDGKIVLGQNGAISVIDKEKNISSSYIESADGRVNVAARVMDLAVEPSTNSIWFCALGEGIGVIEGGNIRWKHRVHDIPIYSLTFDHVGTLWVGTGRGLFVYKDGELVSPDFEIDSFVRKVKVFRDSTLAVCTGTQGLYTYKNGVLNNYKSDNIKPGVYNVCLSNTGEILVGTGRGLYSVLGDKLEKYYINNEHIGRPIYFIETEGDTICWIGTDRGVIKYYLGSRYDYNIYNGLAGNECNRSAAVFDDAGHFWIGTDGGVSKYDSHYDYKSIDPSYCYINSIQNSSDEKFSLLENLEFSSDEVIIFNYRDLSYLAEDKNMYVITLKDASDDPVVTDTTYLNSYKFIALSPGRYTFEVSVINPVNVKSNRPAVASFSVRNPFYNQWWFVAGIILFLFTFVYNTVKFYQKKNYSLRLENEIENRIKEIKQNEQNLSITLNSIGDGVIATDSEGRIKRMNPVAERITGWKFEEAKNKDFETVFNIYNSLTGEKAENIVEKVIKYKKVVTIANDSEIHCKKGDVIPIADSAAPIIKEYGEIIGVVAVFRDLSERYHTKKELEESNRRFYVLSESAFEGIAIIKYDKVIYITNQFSAMLGYAPEEIKDNEIFDYVFDTEIDEFKKYLASPEEKKYETAFKKKDGSSFIAEVRTRDIKFYGQPMTALVVRDITDIKKAEAKLIEAKDEAEKSDRIKSEFLAQMSHEIRTPVNIITSFTDLIKEKVKSYEDEELEIGFDSIKRSSKRLIRTIDLILNMSAAQSGSINVSPKLIDIKEKILEPLQIEFYEIVKQKNLDLRIIDLTESNKTKVYCDEYTVTQIFNNLIDNSLKYTQEGNIDLLLETDQNDNLRVKIADTGIGISKEFLPKLFSPFAQEEQGYTRRYEGSGLGLSLVKNYCDLNDIEISVESEKNIGTTFILVFNNKAVS